MAIDYNVFYSRKGAAYRKEKVVKHSAYLLPIDTRPGRLAGNSRIWGDASHEVQRQVIDAIIVAAKKEGFNVRRIALLLAMTKIESGVNPDAAAGTTSASGLGQFIKKTGLKYGLDEENRFDVGPSIKALIGYFKDNEALVKKNGDPDYFVYKYHHDGPYQESGGTALANNEFKPLAAAYEKALIAGHVLTVMDPSGQAIADAELKVSQGGKSAMLKTNEHGTAPAFLASPDFGPIQVYIKKVDGTFKYLSDLAIDKLESAWTLVAPKERVPLKTHLHEPKAPAAAPAPDTHKVESGETVSRIARDHGTTYQELCKLNGIEKPYTIYPGQVLKVPPKKAGAAPAHPAAAPAPAPAHKPAAPAAVPKPAAAPAPAQSAPAPAPAKPVVKERRDADSQRPVANVVAPPAGGMAATIAYALKKAHKTSQHKCLKYVKTALYATKMIRTYNAVVAAKDFGPSLAAEGFQNLLETKPGTNLRTAPVGSVIIYRPVEKQVHNGETIYGHIEIKTESGYVSDYLTRHPTYWTNEVTMVSPVGRSIPVSFKVIGIWFKE
jgi:LysM repeat protein